MKRHTDIDYKRLQATLPRGLKQPSCLHAAAQRRLTDHTRLDSTAVHGRGQHTPVDGSGTKKDGHTTHASDRVRKRTTSHEPTHNSSAAPTELTGARETRQEQATLLHSLYAERQVSALVMRDRGRGWGGKSIGGGNTQSTGKQHAVY